MDTKLKGDIAEQALVLKALQQGYDVLVPVGDRLPYDVVLVKDKKFIRCQVKSSWRLASGAYVVDCRTCKTNRAEYKIVKYNEDDFDYAFCYVDVVDEFWILPISKFLSYSGCMALLSSKSKLDEYREAWLQLDY